MGTKRGAAGAGPGPPLHTWLHIWSMCSSVQTLPCTREALPLGPILTPWSLACPPRQGVRSPLLLPAPQTWPPITHTSICSRFPRCFHPPPVGPPGHGHHPTGLSTDEQNMKEGRGWKAMVGKGCIMESQQKEIKVNIGLLSRSL